MDAIEYEDDEDDKDKSWWERNKNDVCGGCFVMIMVVVTLGIFVQQGEMYSGGTLTNFLNSSDDETQELFTRRHFQPLFCSRQTHEERLILHPECQPPAPCRPI